MAASPWDQVLDTEDTAPSASEPLVAAPRPVPSRDNAPAAGGSPWDDVLDSEPSPVIRQDNQPAAAPLAEAKPEPGFVAGLGRGFRSGVSMTPEGAAGLADLFDDMTGDDDPNSTTKQVASWLRDQATSITGGAKPSQSFLGIRTLGDLSTYLGETIGQAAGSTALPAATSLAGAAAGSLAGPGGTVAGGLLGNALPNVAINGIGAMRNSVYEDPEISKLIEDGAVTKQDLVPYIVAGGAIMGGAETFGLSKLMKIAGLGELAKEGGEKALKEAVKLSVRKAILEGTKTEGLTETFQQMVQEVTTVLAGGKPDVLNRLSNVFESGVAGAVGGAALGGGGRAITSAAERLAIPPGQKPDPASVDQETDPSAGTSSPGGFGAPPPQPSGGPGSGAATGAGTTVSTALDADAQAALAGTATTAAGVPVPSPPAPAADVSHETELSNDLYDTPEMQEAFKAREASASQTVPSVKPLAGLPKNGQQSPPAVNDDVTAALSNAKGPVVDRRSEAAQRRGSRPAVAAAPSPDVGTVPAAAAPVATPNVDTGQLPGGALTPIVQAETPAPLSVGAEPAQGVDPQQIQAQVPAAEPLNVNAVAAVPTAVATLAPAAGPAPAEAAGLTQRPPATGATEGPGSVASPAGRAAEQAPDVSVLRQAFQDLKLPGAESTTAAAPGAVASAPAPTGPAPAPTLVPSAEAAVSGAGAPPVVKPRSRAAEAMRQIAERVRQSLDPEQHTQADIDATVAAIVDPLAPELAGHAGSVAEMVRAYAPEAEAAAKARIDTVASERRTGEKVAFQASEIARAEASRTERSAARTSGAAQERARTTKEGEKAAETIATESEAAFARRAAKQVAEKGAAAPAYYHAAVAALARRKATGLGKAKAGSPKESERREANQQLKEAREAELAARQQEEAKTAPAPPKEIKVEKTPEQIRAAAEAALKSAHQRQMEDLTGEREQAITSMALPDLSRMGTRSFLEDVKAALAKLSSNLLPRTLDKNGKPTELPLAKLSRDYPLWTNFLIWAKRLGRQGSEEDLHDFVTAQYFYQRGDFAAVHNMLFADNPDAALEEEQAHVGLDAGEEAFFAIPARQGDAGFEVSEDDGFEAPDAKGYISRRAVLPRSSGESATLTGQDGTTTTVEPAQIHRAGDYLAAVNRAAPSFKGEGLLGRSFALLRTLVVRRLQKLVGDVPVYVVDQSAIQAQLNAEDRGKRVNGLYLGPSRTERARGQKGLILIDSAHDADLHFGEPGLLLHTMLHELTHAATQLGLYENWNGTRDILRRIYVHARNQNLLSREYGFVAGSTEEDRMAEFLAEALSNPAFQRLLADTTLPPKLAAEMRALSRGRAATWWDMMVSVVANAINLTGLGTGGMSALEAVLRVTPDTLFSEPEQYRKARHAMLKEGVASSLRAHMDPRPLALTVQDAFEAARLKVDPAGSLSSLSVLRNRWLETTQGLARKSREVFGGLNNPLERAANLFMSKQTAARRHAERGERVVAKYNSYRKAHPAAGEALSDVMHDATVAGVDPRWDESVNVANGYFSAQGTTDEWRRQVYRRVRQEWLALPAEARAIGDEMSDHYGSASLEMTTQTVRNIVEEAVDAGKVLPAGETLDSVTQWVLSGEVNRQTGSSTNPRTQRDDDLHAALGDLAQHLGKTGLFQGSQGMYVPLIREGQYFVSGEVPVAVPPGAVRASATPASLPGRKATDHLLVFHAAADVQAYQQSADQNGIQISRVESIWVDPATGQRQLKQEPSSVQRWVVTVQNKVVEFHDSLTQAQDREREMRAQGMVNVRPAQTRAKAFGSNEMLPPQVEALVRSVDRNQANQGKSDFLTAAIREAAIRQMAGTRMQQRRLRRRGVKGFSQDLVQSGLTYNSSYANHMASLVEGRGMWKALQAAKDYSEDPARAYVAGPETQQRKVLVEELEDRIQAGAASKAGSDLVQVATSLSFASHLMSVSYNILNAMQTGMVTLPYLSGKYGMGATFGQLSRALKDMGAETTRTLGRGLTDTARQAKRFATLRPTDQGLDYFGQMKRRFAGLPDGALLTQGLDRLNDLGLFDGMAGIDAELAEYNSGPIAKFMSRLTRVGRAMPEAIEANNRVMTLVMAMRLAVKQGANDEAALAAGVDAVEETQGGYSKANSPTVFNAPFGTVMLQFKKYGLMMGNLLGRNIRRVIQPKNRQERIAAAKTLTGLIATHVGMAGMVGFPFLEIPKALTMALLPLLGGSGDWDDYEKQFQGWIAKLIGGMPAEVVMRGLPRLMGIDLSNRVGLDSLLLFGQPRDTKEDSVKAWLFSAIMGPVVGMAGDAVKAFTDGDWTKLPVPKFVKDATHAYQEMGGKTGKTGRETKPPTTPYETGLKVIGLRPASEARYWETGTGAARVEKLHAKDTRFDLSNRWLVVPKGPDQGKQRSKIYNDVIRPYNVGKRGRDRIELGDLYRQERSRQKTTREEKRGEAQRLAR